MKSILRTIFVYENFSYSKFAVFLKWSNKKPPPPPPPPLVHIVACEVARNYCAYQWWPRLLTCICPSALNQNLFPNNTVCSPTYWVISALYILFAWIHVLGTCRTTKIWMTVFDWPINVTISKMITTSMPIKLTMLVTITTKTATIMINDYHTHAYNNENDENENNNDIHIIITIMIIMSMKTIMMVW